MLNQLLKFTSKTIRADRRHHQPKNIPLTPKRLVDNIFPNLKQPIFLVGAPRSGTTFLGDCLGALPEISYHFEPVATKAASRHVYEGTWNFNQSQFFYKQVYGWLMRIYGEGGLTFCEKTPRNCFIIPFLYKVFPDARFINIIRDGRDVALSYSKKPWLQAASSDSGKLEPGGYPFGAYPRYWVEPQRREEFQSTTDIHRCIWAWRRHLESALKAQENLPPDQYLEIRYEALVSNPKTEGERLLNYLDIRDIKSRQKFEAMITNANQDSIGNWKNELSAEQLDKIQQEAGDLLNQLNYS